MAVLGRLASPQLLLSSRFAPVTVSRRFSHQVQRTSILFSHTVSRTITRIYSPHYLHPSHARSYSSKPTPTSSTQPVYSQTDDALLDNARGDTTTTHSIAADHSVSAVSSGTDATAEVVSTTSEAISSFPPINFAAEFLTWVHQSTGMPWWLTIMAATTCVRVCLFPVMAHVMRNNLKLAEVKPMMDIYTLRSRMATTPEARAQATRDLYEFMGRQGVNPMKSMIGILAQTPVFMMFYFTIKAMTEHNVDHMDVGGALWFENLTIPDPYYLLSIATAATFLLSVELGAETGQSMAKSTALIRNIFRFMAVVFIPITATFPAGMLVYWAYNSFLSLVQMLVFKLPAVRKFFRLPKPATNKSKVEIPDIIYSSPPGSKDRKPINNNPKK